MVRAAAVLLLLTPLLAGCLSEADDATTDAAPAFDVADDAARDRFGYTLFLGITGTEGPLDWNRYEEALETAGGAGASLASFDQDVPNGRLGDGRLGAWLTTHFAYDEDERLIGGLYTQVFADGSKNAAFAAFTGPYSGTTQLPSMLQEAQANPSRAAGVDFSALLPLLAAGARADADPDADPQPSGEDPVLCALSTHTDDWLLSSEDAARVALADEEFQAHVEALPDGELSYYYFPGLAVEDACPVDIEVPHNFWAVSYTDLDAFLDPETPSPPLFTLRIDAETGSVDDRSLEPLVLRPPTILEHLLVVDDPAVPETRPHTEALVVPVEENAARLELQTYRTERPNQLPQESTRLRDPHGRIVAEHKFSDGALHHYEISDPLPGDWRLEYHYQSLTPNGHHELEVHGAVSYH